MKTETTLAARLKTARLKAGLTQGEVAKAVGISQPTYSNLESGVAIGSKFTPQIAEILSVSALWLATGADFHIPIPKTPQSEEWAEVISHLTTLPEDEQVRVLRTIRALINLP